MADRALRGMRLGTQSMESTIGADFAARNDVVYDCPNGHVTTLPFSIEADVPSLWECHCGAHAKLRHGAEPEYVEQKQVRTHWDMLLERRSVAELEVLLEERLSELRAGRLTPSR